MKILFNKRFWKEREVHRERIRLTLQEFIENPTRDKLIRVVGEIWALRFTYRDLEWYINQRVLKYSNLAGLAEAFKILIDESLPLSERLAIKIPGFGSGAVSEILFSLNPDKFPVYNRKFVVGAEKLGYNVGSLEHVIRLTPDTLKELVRVHEQILADFSDLRDEVIRRTGVAVPRFDFTDGLLWKVAQDEISVKDLLAWRKPHNPVEPEKVDLVLKALKKGITKYLELVNGGEPEKTALEKAAFYTQGLLEAYGLGEGEVSGILRPLNELLVVILRK